MPQSIVLRVGQELVGFAHESITIDSTSGGKGFTLATYTASSGVARALITAETAQMRYTYDGTAPTTTVGHLLEVGDVLIVEGRMNIDAFRAIRTGGSSGAITVTYERYY